jgi:predicted nuclease of predicted toxin-antitoxin system
MKLLFDQNLSPRLVNRLAAEHPGSAHVATVSLDRTLDIAVWTFARDHGFAIVTKDADFSDLSVLLGFPPKIVWLRLGNCSTNDIEARLRLHRATIDALELDPNTGIIELF